MDLARQKPAKPKHDPNHRSQPELALKLNILVAQWFPNEEIIVSGDSAYGGQSILSHLPPNVHLISHVHPKGALYEPAPPKKEKCKGRARKPIEPPSAAPSRPVNFFSDVLGSRHGWCLSYFTLRRRESVALYTLVLIARGLAWPERLGPCHW